MTHQIEQNVDELLRDYYEPLVADDGFCEQVMQKIPAQRKYNYTYFLITLLIGLCVFLWQLTSTALFQHGWQDWMQGDMSLSAVGLCAVLFSMTVCLSWWLLSESE
jgi:hypothetical protein